MSSVVVAALYKFVSLPDYVELADPLREFCKEQGVKMGQVGMPVRALVCGTTQTPSVDATLALIGKDETLRRMDQYLI